MLEWFRAYGSSCGRWVENGFPLYAQFCARPEWPWIGVGLVALLITVTVLVLSVAMWPSMPPAVMLLVVIPFLLAALGLMVSVVWVVLAAADLWAPVLLDTMSRPWFVVPMLVLAVVLYGLRCQNSFVYGCIEIAVGITTIAAVAMSAGSASSVGASLLSKGLGLTGGIYIIVRGLDNVGKGLPQRWKPVWTELFRVEDTGGVPPGAGTPPPATGMTVAGTRRTKRGGG